MEKIRSNQVKKGDILLIPSSNFSKTKMIIVSDEKHYMSRVAAYKIDAIKFADVDLYLSGDGKDKGYYKVRINNFDLHEKVGEYADVDSIINSVKDIKKGISESKQQRGEEIKMVWDHESRYYLELQDGSKAYPGDTILVKFSNGNFNLILGNAKGEIIQEKNYVYVRRDRGSRARSVNYKNLLKKI